MDEQQLIAGCKSENRLAQRELYEKYARRMLAVCLRYVNDMETARDLLQDGFVRVFTNILILDPVRLKAGFERYS